MNRTYVLLERWMIENLSAWEHQWLLQYRIYSIKLVRSETPNILQVVGTGCRRGQECRHIGRSTSDELLSREEISLEMSSVEEREGGCQNCCQFSGPSTAPPKSNEYIY